MRDAAIKATADLSRLFKCPTPVALWYNASMASFEFRLPDIGEGVAEGEVVAWHVKPGDHVTEDQTMVEVMTDKATVTIGAPRAGKVAELRVQVGEVANVGDVLVIIETGNGHSLTPSGKPEPQKVAMAASAVGDIREALPGTAFITAAAKSSSNVVAAANPLVNVRDAQTMVPGTDYFSDKPLATPATRKLARDLDLDLRRVSPSGPAGRVTKEDVLSARDNRATLKPIGIPPHRSSGNPPPVSGGETRVPLIGMRRKIAERMQTAKNTAAHFTFVEECDLDRLVDVRARLAPQAEAQGVRLNYLPFIVQATIAALRKHPMLNCMLDPETNEIVMRDYFHIGVAAATEQGLVVPVVHHAEKLSLLDLAREIERLGVAAREGKLTAAELTGSTFTITSLGRQAGLFATPIINLPNVGILGVHRIKEKPVVKNGAIVIGNVMLLSLSLDHRIVDGHVGAAFAYELIGLLEDPLAMLIDLS